MKREAKFQTFFSKWIKNNLSETAVFELKVAKNKSIPFSALKPHQSAALKEARHGQLVWKLPDCGWENPFDCFSLCKVPAYVVVLFPSKYFYIIDIDWWENESKESTRKSLTELRAKCIRTYGGKLSTVAKSTQL